MAVSVFLGKKLSLNAVSAAAVPTISHGLLALKYASPSIQSSMGSSINYGWYKLKPKTRHTSNNSKCLTSAAIGGEELELGQSPGLFSFVFRASAPYGGGAPMQRKLRQQIRGIEIGPVHLYGIGICIVWRKSTDGTGHTMTTRLMSLRRSETRSFGSARAAPA